MEDYRRATGQSVATKSKQSSKAKRDNDLAMATLIGRLERLGYDYHGVWRKGMEVQPRSIYLEYVFSTARRFRADLSIPTERLILEIHGGAWVKRRSSDGKSEYMGGAHHSPAGRRRDMEKSNLANLEGWTYLEVEWIDVKDGSAYDLIVKALGGEDGR